MKDILIACAVFPLLGLLGLAPIVAILMVWSRKKGAEDRVRRSILAHLEPDEELRHFTWSKSQPRSESKDTASEALESVFDFLADPQGASQELIGTGLLFGLLRVLRDWFGKPRGYYIGLTNKRIILKAVERTKPEAEAVRSLPLEEIRGLEYRRGSVMGSLVIHMPGGNLAFDFDSEPWFPRAIQMAKMLPPGGPSVG